MGWEGGGLHFQGYVQREARHAFVYIYTVDARPTTRGRQLAFPRVKWYKKIICVCMPKEALRLWVGCSIGNFSGTNILRLSRILILLDVKKSNQKYSIENLFVILLFLYTYIEKCTNLI